MSIIVVNWNTRELLRDCLASVFANLGGLAVEVIVVDNGSNDGSQTLVGTDFPQVRLIENTENRGFAAANNQAIEVASGKYILLLNSDTIVLGHVLADSVRYLDKHADVGAMGCRVLNKDRTMQPTCMQFPSLINLVLMTTALDKLPWPPVLDRYLMRRWQRTDVREVEVISGCYIMVRACVVKQVGLLDEDFFFFGEETDWCMRIRKADWLLHFTPVGEIIHYGGASASKLKYKKDLLLTSGLIRLHKKHCGFASAIAAWVILLAFNSSRSMFWTLRAIFSSKLAVRHRRDHFVAVTTNFRQAWPTDGPKST